MKINILLLFLIIGQSLFAQIKIVRYDDLSTAINGSVSEFQKPVTDLFPAASMFVINESGGPLELYIRRKRLIDPPTNVTEQLCNSTQCYNTGDNNIYITPAEEIVAPGDTMILKPQFVNDQDVAFCAFNRYYLQNNFGLIYDSVDVKFNIGNQDCSGTASLDENKIIAVSVFPNPAKDKITLDVDSSEESNLEVFDALGQKVLTESLIQGKNTVNIEKLNNGVYFYILKTKTGVATEAKRLVVSK